MRADIVAVAAVEQVVALAAEEHIGAEPAVHRELDAVGFERVASTTSSPPWALSDEPIVGLLLVEDVDGRLQAEDVDSAGVARGAEHVVALGAVDGDGVGRAVAAAVGAAAGRSRSTRVDVGAAQVADDDVVGAAEGAESICSTSSRSIVTLATSRRKQDAAAVGRDVDILGDVGAEEEQACRRRPGLRPCRCRRPGPTGRRRRRRP